jgi:hypothetical protein
MHKMFGIVAFLDYGLPSLIKFKNVIRVRHNHLTTILRVRFTNFKSVLKFGTREVSTLEVFASLGRDTTALRSTTLQLYSKAAQRSEHSFSKQEKWHQRRMRSMKLYLN